MAHEENSSASEIARTFTARAWQVLAKNDLGSSTRPSPRLYPHQWNWDSAFIAIGLAHGNLERAEREVLSLLRGQWRNGMIPHIIYNPTATGYFPDAQRWRISRSRDAPKQVQTSGITQPPMITISVRTMADRPDTLGFLRTVFPSLLKYHRWFHRERDPLGQGLVAIVHPWESGLDNSPRWLGVLDRILVEKHPEYSRQDNSVVSSTERPTDHNYDRFVFLMDLASELAYDQTEIQKQSPFIVQDVLVNSVLYRADECLLDLAIRLGEPTTEIENWMAATRAAFGERFWHEREGLFFDYDARREQSITENTISTFMPLYAGLAESDQAKRVVENHLMSPLEYAPGPGSSFRVPTASKDNRYFDPRAYWRGPIWINMNWFLIHGLERYHYREYADQIRRDTLTLVERSGFFEYFDPLTGAGYGTDSFSWSAALTLDLLAPRLTI